MKKIIKGKIKLHPLAKDKSKIPFGMYCYNIINYDKKRGIVQTKTCPYYISKEPIHLTPKTCGFEDCEKLKNGECNEFNSLCLIQVAGCSFLDIIDKDEDTLLWDKCKECGINESQF